MVLATCVGLLTSQTGGGGTYLLVDQFVPKTA